MRHALLACALLFLLLAPVHAKIYKWTDHNGKVHFTDNMAAVPPEYREQVEEKTSTLPPSEPLPGTSGSAPSAAGQLDAVKHHVVPLQRVGDALLVEAILGSSLKSRLIVDTGATFTVIPMAAAKQLSLDLDNAAVIPLRSVSGTFLAPLTKVKSMRVGDATVRDVEVVVYDIAPEGGVGLLGMSFLGDFQVTINAEKKAMILTDLARSAGEALYGGRPEDWWRRKFRYYRRQIESLEAYFKEQASPKATKTLRYFQAELDTLDRQATQAAVPRQWRY
jgi:clan AA aspartic protease (TIGR02281 family)